VLLEALGEKLAATPELRQRELVLEIMRKYVVGG